MKAKRSLGQNFLTAPSVVARMIEASELQAGEVIVEIGPGKGALTEQLLATGHRVIALEKDDALYEELKDTFHKQLATGQLTLMHTDALEESAVSLDLKEAPYVVIANIPFNITGALLRQWLAGECQPRAMVVLVQKEVGERMVARDGKESILSMSVKVFGEPSYVCTVKAGSFHPKPKVDCAVVAIRSISRQNLQTKRGEEQFFQLVKAGFAQKRKQIKGNLADFEGIEAALSTCQIALTARAEDLKLKDWRCLKQNLEAYK